jgi:hypothetical protein
MGGPESERQVRKARTAVALLFLTNGALFRQLVPSLPRGQGCAPSEQRSFRPGCRCVPDGCNYRRLGRRPADSSFSFGTCGGRELSPASSWRFRCRACSDLAAVRGLLVRGWGDGCDHGRGSELPCPAGPASVRAIDLELNACPVERRSRTRGSHGRSSGRSWNPSRASLGASGSFSHSWWRGAIRTYWWGRTPCHHTPSSRIFQGENEFDAIERMEHCSSLCSSWAPAR